MTTNLFLTLIIAFIIIVLAIACLAIGWLITGKTKIEKACGQDPHKKKDESCGDIAQCNLCSPETKKKTSSENLDTEKDKHQADTADATEEGDKRY